jgi:hypothetical protein
MSTEINTSYDINFRTGNERYEILYTLDRRVFEKEVGKGESDKAD